MPSQYGSMFQGSVADTVTFLAGTIDNNVTWCDEEYWQGAGGNGGTTAYYWLQAIAKELGYEGGTGPAGTYNSLTRRLLNDLSIGGGPYVKLDGSTTMTGGLEINADESPLLTITRENDGSDGIVIKFYHDSASSVINDNILEIQAKSNNVSGVEHEYGALRFEIARSADLSESGRFDIDLCEDGAEGTTVFTLSGDTDGSARYLYSKYNVGIGTTSPDTTLHVMTASAGVQSASSGTSLLVESNADSYIEILVPDTYSAGIYFSSVSTLADASITWSDSTDVLSLATSASSSINLNAGEVGINVTSPGATLHVRRQDSTGTPSVSSILELEHTGSAVLQFLGATNSDQYIFFGDVTSASQSFIGYDHGTNLFWISNSSGPQLAISSTLGYFTGGNFGIGTATPNVKLHTIGTSSNDIVRIGHSDLTQYVGIGYRKITVGGTDTNIDLELDSKGSGDILLNTNDGGNVGIGTTAPTAKLQIDSDGTVKNDYFSLNDTAASGKRYTFYNRLGGVAGTFGIYDSTAAATRLAIDTNGNVGIGTKSPEAALTVQDENAGTNSVLEVLKVWRSTSGTAAAGLGVGLSFELEDNAGGLRGAGSIGSLWKSAASGTPQSNLFFKDNAGNTLVTMEYGGNVGIGTTSPDNTLHVHKASAGSVSQTGTSYVLVLENNTDCALQFLSPAANVSGFTFGDPSSLVSGSFTYSHSADAFYMYVLSTSLFVMSSTTAYFDAVNFGIGTTSPDNKFHVFKASAGTVTANTSTTTAVFENNTDNYIQMLSPNTNVGGIWFGDPESLTPGGFNYDHSTSYMTWFVSGFSTMFLSGSSGTGKLGIGNTATAEFLRVTGDASTNPVARFETTNGTARNAYIEMYGNFTPGAVNIVGSVAFAGKDAGATKYQMGRMYCYVSDITTGSPNSYLYFETIENGTINTAMYLTDAGTLNVDLSGTSGSYANVNLFDEWDDPVEVEYLIKDRSKMSKKVRDAVVDVCPVSGKEFLRLQPALNLFGGMGYQIHHRLSNIEEMVNRLGGIDIVESALSRLIKQAA